MTGLTAIVSLVAAALASLLGGLVVGSYNRAGVSAALHDLCIFAVSFALIFCIVLVIGAFEQAKESKR